MMYPVCVSLPESPAVAAALWTVLDCGWQQQQSRGARPTTAAQRQHTDTLLHLLRAKLAKSAEHPECVWVERREVADILFLVDEGLQVLSRQPEGNGPQPPYALAVQVFLQEIRKRLPTPRKPVTRQSQGDRALAAAAVNR
ncbi:MAG: hypothetical protein MUF01_16320 [Bryobacterales bacterium]|jgi:hypothetical protein|nr:hypothetical protein [Bryobacterales bacterium]